MNRKTVIIMAVIVAIETAVLVALVFSINPSDTSPAITNPDKIEGRKPLSWDAQENRDWLYAMPYKADMRHMWIDCNRMVSAGRGEKKTEYAEIYTAARDIAQRSGNYAALWEETATRYEELLDNVEDMRANDWFLFDIGVNMAWSTCNTCHLSAWSPHYLHVTKGTTDAWTHNRLTPHEGNIKAKNPPPEIQNRRSMRALADAFKLIDECNLKKDPKYVDQMIEGANTIIRIARERATFWSTINEQAKIMALNSDIDEVRDVDVVREAYNVMTAQCIACHATQAGEMREIMTPLSWHK